MSSITWDGSGGLFTQLGHFISLAGQFYGLLGSDAPDPSSDWGSAATDLSIHTVDTQVASIVSEHSNSFPEVIEDVYEIRDTLRGIFAGVLSTIRSKCEQIIILHVDNESDLPSLTIDEALEKMITYMNADSEDVKTQSVTAAVTAGSNTGDAKILVSLLDTDGSTKEYSFGEAIGVVVTDQSTADSETFTFTGQRAAADPLSYNWPLGSGSSNTVSAADPTLDAGVNLLTNSDFNDWTDNVPDNWATVSGTAGTDFQRETSEVYRTGQSSLEFLSDDSTLAQISQEFSDSDGTTSVLSTNTLYAFHYWAKASTGSLTKGTLKIQLINASTGSVLTDDAGNNCEVSLDATTLTTSWAAKSGWVATPNVLPAAGVKVKIGMTAVHDDTEKIYVADLAMIEGTTLYAGGPTVAVATGATTVVSTDTWTVTITNDRTGLWQVWFDRLFGMRERGLQLPSAGSPQIADTLITN